MKKPFSMRVEERVSDRFKSLATVLGMNGDKLLEEMVNERSENLTEKQRTAFDAILIAWKEGKEEK